MQSECSDCLPMALSFHQDCPYIKCLSNFFLCYLFCPFDTSIKYCVNAECSICSVTVIKHHTWRDCRMWFAATGCDSCSSSVCSNGQPMESYGHCNSISKLSHCLVSCYKYSSVCFGCEFLCMAVDVCNKMAGQACVYRACLSYPQQYAPGCPLCMYIMTIKKQKSYQILADVASAVHYTNLT